ncbi:energy transducer TonB family protein [Methylobacterium nigriterrae]|uniref:energy transducer TonB family protein n=1 Tax=Methylobacterium nigriterrae TaxID=3127512 RepID=UPI0030138D29
MSTFVSTGDSGRGPSGLAAAFLAALALHLAALVGIAFYRLTPPAPPGENTISIDLAPQMTEADTQAPSQVEEAQVAPPEASTVEPPNPVEAVKPPEAAEMVPEEAVAVKPPEAVAPPPPDAVAVEPESQVITSTAEQAEPLAPPPPLVAQAPEPKPIEETKPKPDPAKVAAEREARLKAIRDAKRKAEAEERRKELLEERREAAQEAKEKAAREAKARAAATARAGRDASNSASASRQSAGGSAAAGNDPNALRQWQGALSSAIHGRMNRNAAAGTGGGVATVRFTVARSGQVLSAGLAGSSGIGAIDSAALAAVRGTLPAAPAGVTVSSLSVTVPMRFSPGR